MQEMTEFLSQYKEPMPEWLKKLDPNDYEEPKLEEVLNSRVAFYPACYSDGFMVEVFNSSHSAHVYQFYFQFRLFRFYFFYPIQKT